VRNGLYLVEREIDYVQTLGLIYLLRVGLDLVMAEIQHFKDLQIFYQRVDLSQIVVLQIEVLQLPQLAKMIRHGFYLVIAQIEHS